MIGNHAQYIPNQINSWQSWWIKGYFIFHNFEVISGVQAMRKMYACIQSLKIIHIIIHIHWNYQKVQGTVLYIHLFEEVLHVIVQQCFLLWINGRYGNDSMTIIEPDDYYLWCEGNDLRLKLMPIAFGQTFRRCDASHWMLDHRINRWDLIWRRQCRLT